MKEKIPIPREIKRQILIEAGYRCSIPHCSNDSALDFHHIDGNPANNEARNILLVCSNHHRKCTSGQIDRKACQFIKNELKSQKINVNAGRVTTRLLRKILREELYTTPNTLGTKNFASNAFPSIFDRKHLFLILDKGAMPSYESYLAISVLGELKYRGCGPRIISFIENLRNEKNKKTSSDFEHFFRAAVRSLSNIQTKTALNWLADELINKSQNEFNKMILFFAIASAGTSKKYLRFEITGKDSIRKGDGGIVTTISFLLRGKRGKFELKLGAHERLTTRSIRTR